MPVALIVYFTGAGGLLLMAVFVQLMVRAIRGGALPVNGLLGLRTPATKRSPAAWDAGHRAAEPGLRVLVVVTAAAAVLPLPFAVGLGYRTDRATTATEIALGAGYAAVLGLLLVIARTADRAARAESGDRADPPRAAQRRS